MQQLSRQISYCAGQQASGRYGMLAPSGSVACSNEEARHSELDNLQEQSPLGSCPQEIDSPRSSASHGM